MKNQDTKKDIKNEFSPKMQAIITEHNCEQFLYLLIDPSTIKYDDEILSDGYGITKRGKLQTNEKGQEIEVAVKFMDTQRLDDDDDNYKYFFREIQCHILLQHEAILPFIGFFIPTVKSEECGIVREFMPNYSLKKLINQVKTKCPENWETIKAINIFGIAAGMAYIHQHDIIHRDLQPSSVLLDKNFHPKIGGFSLSKIFKQGTENEIMQTISIGTPYFMSPEVFHDNHYSNKIDVYSYSILLYQILSLSENPYNGSIKVRTLRGFVNNIDQGYRPNINVDGISDEFADLIGRCWNADPDCRPSFIQIVKEFMDKRKVYFTSELIDEKEFDDYIELVTKDLDFSDVSDHL